MDGLLKEDSSCKDTVIAIVDDLIQDWGVSEEGSTKGSTLLVNDLDFASVDIIQLCVALEQHYERKLGFNDLLMVNGSYVGDLSIAQIAGFIETRLREGN